ncbi:hypothetical protein EROM_041220 [Encephalitozoon romaleae SJ-2008]|uniref:Hpc2-related domain-containing protein n=1 Tax=Encephalitozoon romaleae (strain SJ-2008) TaxID=1178016 RepID=I6ZI39_ENCRO|nr:hypothetical protein EROM_041220 [Encephalitozoon romaleae SJ-2008]AFN82888.1 hypothetical protein EROM_041220 [Encephalitozoon romaleae SJ-2008]
MNPENEVTIQVNVMEPKEIDLRKKEKQKKRRQRTDEYDYNDPFIEPFEGETQMVMIESSLEDFFVYKGELPYSAKKVLSVHKARERAKLMKSSSIDVSGQKAEKRGKDPKRLRISVGKGRRRRIPKSDTKICDCLASLIKSEVGNTGEVPRDESDYMEYYVSLKVLEAFQKEREVDWRIQNLDALKKPSDEEIARYLKKSESAMNELFNTIAGEIQNYQLYSEDLSLFKGFQKESFLFNTCKYFLLFIKISFMGQEGMTFNKARKEAYNNVLGLFPNTCKNSTQTQYYLAKRISQTCEMKDFAECNNKEHKKGNEDRNVSSNLESIVE